MNWGHPDKYNVHEKGRKRKVDTVILTHESGRMTANKNAHRVKLLFANVYTETCVYTHVFLQALRARLLHTPHTHTERDTYVVTYSC